MSKTSVNWTAPEIFAPEDRNFRPTFASDIYALGMLIYEVNRPARTISSHAYLILSPIGAHWTLPIPKTRQVGVGIPSRSREQATASPTGLREIGNHRCSMGYDRKLLGQKSFCETPNRERYPLPDKGYEGAGRGRSSVLACERSWDRPGHGSEG